MHAISTMIDWLLRSFERFVNMELNVASKFLPSTTDNVVILNSHYIVWDSVKFVLMALNSFLCIYSMIRIQRVRLMDRNTKIFMWNGYSALLIIGLARIVDFFEEVADQIWNHSFTYEGDNRRCLIERFFYDAAFINLCFNEVIATVNIFFASVKPTKVEHRAALEKAIVSVVGLWIIGLAFSVTNIAAEVMKYNLWYEKKHLVSCALVFLDTTTFNVVVAISFACFLLTSMYQLLDVDDLLMKRDDKEGSSRAVVQSSYQFAANLTTLRLIFPLSVVRAVLLVMLLAGTFATFATSTEFLTNKFFNTCLAIYGCAFCITVAITQHRFRDVVLTDIRTVLSRCRLKAFIRSTTRIDGIRGNVVAFQNENDLHFSQLKLSWK
ncbi:unnamed protein product [Toxocara canis]|uniref:G_PROTEIN_RECEP_F1_2 domain-containing protein n=1 Tax=Toxocara canis TaxID=6265 RepID=A0A183TVJ4_TOXCA|nr:unnamed protein product [Toxocara canis]